MSLRVKFPANKNHSATPSREIATELNTFPGKKGSSTESIGFMAGAFFMDKFLNHSTSFIQTNGEVHNVP